MGPRSGSPATETLRAQKAVSHRRAATRGGAAAFLFLGLGLIPPAAWAATAETSHQVTVVVVPSSLSVATVNPPEGIELKADVGTFTNNGTDGDIVLHPASSGDQVVGTDPTPLADKEITSGTQANVLNGTLPVTWKAGLKEG